MNENKELETIDPIYNEIRTKLINAKNKIYQTINTTMVDTYWYIGKIIMELQDGNSRAKYGKAIISSLSQKLTAEFGRGFSVDNLENMRKFYKTFPNSETLSRKFELVALFRINKDCKRRRKKFLFK